MHAPPFLLELLLLIAFAAVGVALFERLRLPAITGFLLIGALAGPGGLGLVDDPDRVRELAELGVVFLLFEIGLELPVDRVRRLWRTSLVAGALQVFVTLAVVAGCAVLLGAGWRSAVVIGALVALSSTALVLGQLAERGEVDAPHGQLSLGILIFQDLCIVPFLLVIPILASPAGAGAWGVGLEIGRAGAVLALFYVAARFVLPPLLARVAGIGSRDLFSLLALLVVVGSAVLADSVGLTLAVGAFIGGLVTSTSPYAHQLSAELLPLRGVLLGLFFTAVGMLFDPEAALRDATDLAGYVTGVLVVKTAVVVAVVAGVLRSGLRLGVQTGMVLAQSGEFSFVLAASAAAAGLLEPAVQQTFVAGTMLTLLATPFLIRAAPVVAARFGRLGAAGERAAAVAALEDAAETPTTGHVVVVGYGVAGRVLARVLRSIDTDHVVIDANPRSVADARTAGEPVIYGDATRRALLERVGVARASLVAVAVSDPMATREIVSLVRELAPRAPILTKTRYVLEVDELARRGSDVVVAEEYEASIDLLSEVLRRLGVPEGAVTTFTAQLREEGYEPLRESAALALDPWLAELLDQVATDWVEVPVGYRGEASLAELEVRARTGVNVLARERGGVTLPNPGSGERLKGGDRLLAFGTAEDMGRLRALLAGLAGDGVS